MDNIQNFTYHDDFNNTHIKRINTNYNRCQVVGPALNSEVPSSNPGSGQNASLSAPQSV